MCKKIAVYAGSFNPFTNGHLDIVKQACELFDVVHIVISYNSDKPENTDVSSMSSAISECLFREGLLNCKVSVWDKMVGDFCGEVKADYLIRGIRNTTDYMYEENIAKINLEVYPNLTTIYFRAKNEVLSSSVVREFLKYDKNIRPYVPQEVFNLLLK